MLRLPAGVALCAAALTFVPLAAQRPDTVVGKFERVFAAKIGRAPVDTLHPALVVLHEQMDLRELNRRLDLGNATRAWRHTAVCGTAQEIANRTQPAVRAVVDRLVETGTVREVQPFWIVNAIGLHATAAALATIADHPSVLRIEDGHIEIELVHPVVVTEQTPVTTAPEQGLLDIKADFLWNLGITGQGRIVSNLDTGVFAGHTALSARWRGNQPGVAVSAAWHSPSLRRAAPTDSQGHGTHTMGTMCGDDGGANRVGVAPAAQWIASDAIATTSLTQVRLDVISGFQWSADPDGNIATIDDVPDVSCNSWGLSPLVSSHGVSVCDLTFWAAIDVADAAGCAVVFAAGNEGSRGAQSLRTPADRADGEWNCYSVGALRPGSTAIAAFSSRGPSGCVGNAIKPEVCAQGENVRSTLRTGSYGSMSGTSMACPHVSGAVALLRQVEPNLSSRAVKQLLFDTCDDLGPVGNDNTFGAGRINLQTAYQQLINQRGAVTVGAFTTTRTVRAGSDLVYQINLQNHTASTVGIRFGTDIEIVDLSARGPLLTPVVGGLPANFTLDPSWLVNRLTIPANLPNEFFGWTYRVHVWARDAATNALLSEAAIEFKLTR